MKPVPGANAADNTSAGRLSDLVVLERLEVGPVRVEPYRLTAPYTVVAGGVPHSTELVYRFGEDVFDGGPRSRNLAAMIAAQVAVNYGLFCRRLVFRGPYDEHDRVFLEKFAENTAREIYVNKFLLPNPFLVAPARNMAPGRHDHYLNARIEVVRENDGDDESFRSESANSRQPDTGKHAVLSSGGKDSLLTFGVLRELGVDVDPVFVNESGRHWYTALNAYRCFEKTHPRTARVWTNSDRVFAWMLRHLPFVRPDFSDVRSDEYPIRLWTVAVFLFGALPLLQKRGIGRLLIGNEYDTTARLTYHGITHYNALFDQSRFFDNEMTRYFKRKGWGVSQFSILRPLSELLIEKVLVERYPELQRHQVSCHAAHIVAGRACPCGSCEKCRRIVGMLLALDADPARCGYDEEQTKRCLDALAKSGVHQEAPGSEQLSYLLVRKGLVSASAAFPPRAHPETMALRFHPVASPVETVPSDLRVGVYRVFLRHAEGALLKNGRVWTPFDPLAEHAVPIE